MPAEVVPKPEFLMKMQTNFWFSRMQHKKAYSIIIEFVNMRHNLKCSREILLWEKLVNYKPGHVPTGFAMHTLLFIVNI